MGKIEKFSLWLIGYTLIEQRHLNSLFKTGFIVMMTNSYFFLIILNYTNSNKFFSLIRYIGEKIINFLNVLSFDLIIVEKSFDVLYKFVWWFFMILLERAK